MIAAGRRAHIVATGGYQPGRPIATAEIERLVGSLTPEVARGLSIEQRFWQIDPETGQHRENNTDLAYKAATQALDTAGIAATEIELLIVATGTPEYALPPVANLLQERLALEKCATLDLRSGGAGWVQALDIVRLYLEQGSYETALVVASESISPALAPVFLGKKPDQIRMRDRLPVYMFGDGAGAAVVQARAASGGVEAGVMRAIGGLRGPGILAVGGGTHAPFHEQQRQRKLVDLQVDVVAAGKFTPVMVTEALAHTLAQSGVDPSTIDHCLIPEGNVPWMLDSMHGAGLATPQWLALENKIFDNLSQTGAVGCAAVPLFLDHAWRTGLVQPGDRLLLMGVEATMWIYAGIIVDWTAPLPVGTEDDQMSAGEGQTVTV